MRYSPTNPAVDAVNNMNQYLDLLGAKPKTRKKKQGLLSKSGMINAQKEPEKSQAELAADYVRTIREATESLKNDTTA
tara:strand:- start:1333 stop:1566 length:234 start_codon:yes stop_codon:yes gene_type:complete